MKRNFMMHVLLKSYITLGLALVAYTKIKAATKKHRVAMTTKPARATKQKAEIAK